MVARPRKRVRRIYVHIAFALAAFAGMMAALVDGPTPWRGASCIVLASVAFLWGYTAR